MLGQISFSIPAWVPIAALMLYLLMRGGRK